MLNCSVKHGHSKASKQKKRWRALFPDGTCYAIGDQYLRRDMYNRMSPIEAKAVRAAIMEITSEEVIQHPEYSTTNEWPVFLALLKRRINEQRNQRGDYVHMSKIKAAQTQRWYRHPAACWKLRRCTLRPKPR